jgi:hypothetical protein
MQRKPKRTANMKAKAHIVSERHDSYMGKKGKVEQVIVSCLDLDPDHAFLNTFDFVLGEEEVKAHAGKLQGKQVELGIRNFEPSFGNRLRARGEILGVL